MKTNSIIETLQNKLSTLSGDLLTYKAQGRAGALKENHLIKQTRKEIARTLQALEQASFEEALQNWLSMCEETQAHTDAVSA